MRTLNDQWDDTERKWTDSPLRPVTINNMHTGTRVQHKRYEAEELARLEHNRAIATAKQAER